jgi:hypothetical protein
VEAKRKSAVVEAVARREPGGAERFASKSRNSGLGLKETRERFESVFGTAPIGMALEDGCPPGRQSDLAVLPSLRLMRNVHAVVGLCFPVFLFSGDLDEDPVCQSPQ